MTIGSTVLKAVGRLPKFNRRTPNIVVLSKKDTASAQALSKRLISKADQSWDLAGAIESAKEWAAMYRPENYDGVAMYAVHHAFALGTASLIMCAAGADELALCKGGNVWLKIPWEGWVKAGRRVNTPAFISELKGRIANAKRLCGDLKNTGELGTFAVHVYRQGDRILGVSRDRRDSPRRSDALHSAWHGSVIMLANNDTRESAISAIADECKSVSTLLVSDSDNEILQFGPKACAVKELVSPTIFITTTDAVPNAVVHTSACRCDAPLLRDWARMGVRVFALSNAAGFAALIKELGSEPNFEIKH